MLNRLSDGTRGVAAVILVVVGAALLFTGTIAFYGREEIIDREAFADRAVVALDDDGLRQLVGREIVVNAVERGSTDLVAARPLLEPSRMSPVRYAPRSRRRSRPFSPSYLMRSMTAAIAWPKPMHMVAMP